MPPRKDGAGLSGMFPMPVPDDEAVTGKLPVVPPVGPAICPVCAGGRTVHLSPTLPLTAPCPLCKATGEVTRDVFEAWLVAHPDSFAARQLARAKP